jgi:hypothetical protein
MFSYTPNGYLIIDPDIWDAELFLFVGRFISLALFHGIQIDFPLAPFYYKIFSHNQILDLSDLADIDPELHKGLSHIMYPYFSNKTGKIQ